MTNVRTASIAKSRKARRTMPPHRLRPHRPVNSFNEVTQTARGWVKMKM
jgi:hypothetical protein